MAEDLVEVDEFTEPVTIPEDGDDRNALSISPAFQALANRTKYLDTRRGDAQRLLPGTELVYTDAARVPERRERSDYLPLTDFMVSEHSGLIEADGCIHVAVSPEDLGARQIDIPMQLRLPTGAQLQNVRAVVRGMGNTTWSLRVRQVVSNPFSAPTVGAATVDTLAFATETDGAVSVNAEYEIDNSSSRIQVVVRAASESTPTLGIMGRIYALHIQWLDPGPRSGS